MDAETRQCQSCKSDFVIEPEDFDFYKKINIPAPTWCPKCRIQRRLIWRNERSLYKTKCGLCGKQIISAYSPETGGYLSYCHDCWWGDGWDPISFGKDIDFSSLFFTQLSDLMKSVPYPNLINVNGDHVEYCNFTYQSKSCYLSFASDINENCSYLYHSIENKESSDLLGCKSMEWCCEGVNSQGCYQCDNIFFSSNCINSSFLYNCHNCQNCFGCTNLRNKKFHIFNDAYSEEEYKEKLKTLNKGSFSNEKEIKGKFKDLSRNSVRRFASLIHTTNSTGEYLSNVKNCKDCFDIEGPAENLRYVVYGIPGIKDSMDIYGTGANTESCCELTASGANLSNAFFTALTWEGYDIHYSLYCKNSSHLFGCVGLRNKEYCILNKQYTKEEYEKLVPQIIKHMNEHPHVDSKGRIYKYGEFFPPELSPFAYNETIAQEYFPLNKEKATSSGFRWVDSGAKSYIPTKTATDLPDDIKEVSDSITQEVIECSHKGKCRHQCATAFKIIPQELNLYRKLGLPLPRYCSNCRHHERLTQRNPLKLWKRKCQCAGTHDDSEKYKNTSTHQHHGENHCPNEFETSYSPERKEIVYCEECYQQEVV